MSRTSKYLIFALTLALTTLLFGFLPFSDMPAQPIDFSHRIHAGDNKIPCQYCHTGARRSPSAGIPSVSRCMGCHKIIATNKPEIQKLAGYYERGESIPWVRIYQVPEFVYFNHEPHIRRQVACQTCHGEVEKVDRFREKPELEMGWCVKCHRANNAPNDCLICHR